MCHDPLSHFNQVITHNWYGSVLIHPIGHVLLSAAIKMAEYITWDLNTAKHQGKKPNMLYMNIQDLVYG